MTSSLDTLLRSIVGGRTADAVNKAFGYQTVGDLLGHYPKRYALRGELTALTHLPVNENVTIVAEVRQVRERTMRARKGSILEVQISDGTGFLTLTFFNQAWRAAELVAGTRGMFAGKVTKYKGVAQLSHPDYELFDAVDASDSAAAERWAQIPIPVYAATSTVASWQIQRMMDLVLDSLGEVDDPLPAAIREENNFMLFKKALNAVHRPVDDAERVLAQKTLRFHEAFVLQAALLQQRAELHTQAGTPRVGQPGGLRARFDKTLPFTLTNDQVTVGADIAEDMARSFPMNRLVQGEVGSGKTLVALRAMLDVADTQGQSVLLAPTEVLAVQHFHSIVESLGPDMAAQLVPVLLSGQQTAAERKKSLLRIVSGQARIVIGTHALLSDAVSFYDLGLVVIDEQHRFGVEQREKLRLKNTTPPHVLVLTATPIPRTIAMTVFGDLDVSTIRELPAGRPPIESFVVPLADRPGWEGRVWARVTEEIRKGRQCFVVCSAIEPADPDEDEPEISDDTVPRATVIETIARLREHPELSTTRMAIVHGRQGRDEKEAVMSAFHAGDIDLIVATTVIEVGVNVPNASTMVVLDADRFGVSQLHQLRGRVGRGEHPGLCLFVTRAPDASLARQRVDAVAATLDGFELAQVDLELRREGDVLGRTQSGRRSSLKLLRVATDGDIIAEARAQAEKLLTDDPDLAREPILRASITRRLDEDERAYLVTS